MLRRKHEQKIYVAVFHTSMINSSHLDALYSIKLLSKKRKGKGEEGKGKGIRKGEEGKGK